MTDGTDQVSVPPYKVYSRPPKKKKSLFNLPGRSADKKIVHTFYF